MSGDRKLTGRKRELDLAKRLIDAVSKGKGKVLSVMGDPGIGKTAYLDAVEAMCRSEGFVLARGYAEKNLETPFESFINAFDELSHEPIFHNKNFVSFSEIFVVDSAGILVAKASSEDEESIDPDIFAGMFSAVQDFIKDSFDETGGGDSSLGMLEYGDLKILIEHGKSFFLTAVSKGELHPDMRSALAKTVSRIDRQHGELLADWDGDMRSVSPVREMIDELTRWRFHVRRSIMGIELEKERVRTAERVMALLRENAKNAPILLALEDMQWSDDSSRFVLDYVATNIRDMPILLLASCRPGEEEANVFDPNLRQNDFFSEVVLKPLDGKATEMLVRSSYSPNDFSEDFIDGIYEASQGNPLFIQEVLKQMEVENCFIKDNGTYRVVKEDYAVPKTLEDLFSSRLNVLEPDAINLAEYASCIGRHFLWKDAFSLDLVKGLDSAKGELVTAGLVDERGEKGVFSSILLMDVIYQGISARWKNAYHRSLGEYYEEAFEGKVDEVLYDLARHFGKTIEDEKAFRYALKAGEKAESAYAPEEAMMYYCGAIERLPKAKSFDRKEMETDLKVRIADLKSLTGSVDEAIEEYSNCLKNMEDAQEKAKICKRIADAYQKKGDTEASLNYCNKGLDLLDDAPSLIKSELLGKKSWSYVLNEEFDKALDLIEESRQVAETLDDPENLSAVYHRLGTVHWAKTEYEDALKYLSKAMEMRENLPDKEPLSMTLNNLGLVHSDMGDTVRALEYYEKGLEIYRERNDIHTESMVLSNIGLIYSDMGQYDKAEENYRKSIEQKERIGDKLGQCIAFHNLGLVHQYRGEHREAVENFKNSLSIAEKLGIPPLLIHNQSSLSTSLAEQGDLKGAEAMAQAAGENAKGLGSPGEIGLFHRATGYLKMKEGKYDESEKAYDRALESLEKATNRPGMAEIRFLKGQLYLESGDEGKAREALAKALDQFEEMEMHGWVERIKGLMND